MSFSAVIAMILILSGVIGGFIFFLSLAIKNEKKKNARPDDSAPL